MKHQHLYFCLFLFSCLNKGSDGSILKLDKSEFLDSSFEFENPKDNRILLRTFKGGDNSDYLNFKYIRKVNNKWLVINYFDSIPIPFGLEFNHQDFNGDNIVDFTFLADRGGRGSNFYQHLLLYNPLKKEFHFIKGFDNVCAPAFDSSNNQIIGVGLSGGTRTDFRYYEIQRDTILQDSSVVFEDGKMTERYKFVKGKQIAEKIYVDTTR